MDILGSAEKTKIQKKMSLEQKQMLLIQTKNIYFIEKCMSTLYRTCNYYIISQFMVAKPAVN